MTTPGISIVESRPLRYLRSLPAAHGDPQQKWPVLIFLHGYDEAAPLAIDKALTRHGPLRAGSSRRAVEEFIVIAPQLPRPGDLWHIKAEPVRGIALHVQNELGGDPERTYLSGFSFGGNGVFDLGVAHENLWAALWPVDPTRVPGLDPHCPIWLSIGDIARRGKQEFIHALDLKPAESGLQQDRVYLDEQEDHTGSARRAYQDDRIYSWLLSKRLPTQ